MTLGKTFATLAASALLFAAPAAFAQSAGTSYTGTSNGQQGTPGSSATGSSSSTSGAGTVNPGGVSGTEAGKTTATGGNVGGPAGRN